MTPVALKALKGSIRKWEQIVDGSGEDHGDDNCPLCKVYYHKNCRGCPVAKETGDTRCDGSPYQDQWIQFYCNKAETDDQITAAVHELRFLRSLLPKATKRR